MWVVITTPSVDATVMVSKNYPITGEHVVIIFVTILVTIATKRPAKNTLNGMVKPIFYYRI